MLGAALTLGSDPANDLHLDDPVANPRHAVVEKTSSQWLDRAERRSGRGDLRG